jgi:hypothetical protein
MTRTTANTGLGRDALYAFPLPMTSLLSPLIPLDPQARL